MSALSLADDPVVVETDQVLEGLASAHEGDVRAQIRAIYLMGLEREQIVAVAYREDAIRARIDALRVDDDTRDVIRHAMRWIWKEEQMHATFVRGVLLRVGGPLLRAQAFFSQAAGAIGGWAASVLHHVRWRDAPLSRFWAHAFTFGGWLAGRVPRSVTRGLRHLSFRDYCRFSLAAERSAAMCWHRVAELLESSEGTAAARWYAQMAGDEDHHGAIFGLLLEALDEEGRLEDGWTARRLREALTEVGPFYVAPAHRGDACALGAGGAVEVVCHQPSCRHETAANAEGALRELLERCELDGLLAERAQERGVAVGALRVVIKPTFMRAYHRDDLSVVTSPKLLRELVAVLRERGCEDVALVEGAAIYDWHYENRSVASVARYLGLDELGARVVDVEDDLVPHALRRGMAQDRVSAAWRDADVRIAFGKLSTHPVDQVYLGVSQLESLSPRADENVFLDRHAERGPATMALIGDLPPHLALLDAYEDVPDGICGVIACEAPKAPRRLYGGRDALAVDLVAARHMGERHPEESAHLDAAMHFFGDPRGRTEVRGCDAPIADYRRACRDELSAMLGFVAHPVFVLASDRGRLFSPEMDEAAFPEKHPPSAAMRAARSVVRRLVQIRRPRPALRG